MSNPEAFRDIVALEKETGKIAVLKKHIETLLLSLTLLSLFYLPVANKS